MRTFPVAPLVAAFALSVPGQGEAQDFQIFDHELGRAAAQGEQGIQTAPADFQVRPIAVDTAATRSFKEALYEPLIREAEARYRLPPRLLQALVWTESRFDPMAISPAGAAGLAQLMPATARELGVSNRHDPAQSIDGGARYLKQMLDRFGVTHLALAAYNAGPGAVSRAGGIPRNRETPAYVRSVLRRWVAYGAP